MSSPSLASVVRRLAPLVLLVGLAAPAHAEGRVIKVVARKFEYEPIVLHKGESVVLELTTADRKHGFAVPDLGIRADIAPKKVTRVTVVPDKVGTFSFHCSVFCGSGHEDMTGEIVVEP
jgi:cytochrome c oxidase subunit 2